MKTTGPMIAQIEDYLRYRRSFGYALRHEGGMLLNFGRFADQWGHRGPLTRDLAIRWARLPVGADRLYWARRIEVLIGFARYRQIFDPRTEIPPRHLFGPAHRRKAPYIYSCDQLRALVAAGCEMSPSNGLRPLTYATLLGLLSCTGLRISEALRLRTDDINLKQGVIAVREGKCRSRVVPLHHSAIAPLRKYAARRSKCFPHASFFFVNNSGDHLPYSTARSAFRKLTVQLGWLADGRRPRLHDLRHTFACRVLLRWRFRRAGQEDRIDWLSRYLGHERVSDTYWYLSATPQLFAATAKRFKYPAQQ